MVQINITDSDRAADIRNIIENFTNCETVDEFHLHSDSLNLLCDFKSKQKLENLSIVHNFEVNVQIDDVHIAVQRQKNPEAFPEIGERSQSGQSEEKFKHDAYLGKQC